MGNQTPNAGGQPKPTAPGKPSSRQPPEANTGVEKDREEGQEIPKTGRDPSDPTEQGTSKDTSADDADEDADDTDEDADTDEDDADDTDEDEAGDIELPGEAGEADRLDGSRPAGNP